MRHNIKLFAASFGSELFLTMILFAIAPVILLIFGAEVIGLYGKFQTAVAVCAIFATLRLELTVGFRRNAYLSVLVTTTLLGPCLTLTVAFIISRLWSSNYHDNLSMLQILLMAVSAWLMGYINIFNFHFVATGNRRFLILSKLSRIIVLVFLQLPVAYFFDIYNYTYLIFTFILSLVAFNAVSVLAVWASLSKINLHKMFFISLSRIKQQRTVVISNVLAALMIAVQELLLISLVSRQSLYFAGVFFVADRLLKTPAVMLNQTLRQFILTGRITNIFQLIRLMLIFFACVGGGGYFIFQAIGDWLIKSLNPDFFHVIHYVVILMSFYASSLIVSVFISYFIRMGINRYVLLYSFGMLIITIFSGYLASALMTSLLVTFVSIATLFGLSFSVYLCVMCRRVSKL
jgi:hypothetical protein